MLCRAMTDKPVAPEHLQAVLEAGRLAPTGKNHQPQRLLVVQSPEGLEKMAKAMHNTNAYTAKAVIMVCSDTSDCWVRSFDGHCIHEIDASIVTTYMMLAATEQGLALSGWNGLIRRSCGKNSTCRKTTCRTLCSVWATPSRRQSRSRPATTPNASRWKKPCGLKLIRIDAGILRQ